MCILLEQCSDNILTLHNKCTGIYTYMVWDSFLAIYRHVRLKLLFECRIPPITFLWFGYFIQTKAYIVCLLYVYKLSDTLHMTKRLLTP